MTMHVHILGIAGTFMGGVAAIAKAAGFHVTGADLNVYPPMSTQLTALGIEFIQGYGAEQLDLKPDMVVVGNDNRLKLLWVTREKYTFGERKEWERVRKAYLACLIKDDEIKGCRFFEFSVRENSARAGQGRQPTQ